MHNDFHVNTTGYKSGYIWWDKDSSKRHSICRYLWMHHLCGHIALAWCYPWPLQWIKLYQHPSKYHEFTADLYAKSFIMENMAASEDLLYMRVISVCWTCCSKKLNTSSSGLSTPLQLINLIWIDLKRFTLFCTCRWRFLNQIKAFRVEHDRKWQKGEERWSTSHPRRRILRELSVL